MGIKFGSGKHVHEFLVDVQLDIGDGLPKHHNSLDRTRVLQ